ncbi:MAG TPA: gliding motility lipoprotein GldH [Bacteroidales bacterium]|nr:gliding motility lipoprotein GldH [Bacteroidales bacterium]
MKIIIRKTVLPALTVIVLLTSCGRNTLYSDIVRMKDAEWTMYDPANFSCTVNDTTGSYNVNFAVRTSTDYPYRNLFLFVITTFPSGTSLTDTIQGILTDEKGQWLGKGAGDIREVIIPYKSNIFFPETGEYHFRVIHGMRDTVLNGVYDLGMKISLRTD